MMSENETASVVTEEVVPVVQTAPAPAEDPQWPAEVVEAAKAVNAPAMEFNRIVAVDDEEARLWAKARKRNPRLPEHPPAK